MDDPLFDRLFRWVWFGGFFLALGGQIADHRLCFGLHPELSEEALGVAVDGLGTHRETLCDLLVVPARGKLLEDRPFARSQAQFKGVFLTGGAELVQHLVHHDGINSHSTREIVPNRVQDFLDWRGLEQITIGSQPERLGDEVVIREGGEHKNFGIDAQLSYVLNEITTRGPTNEQVNDNDIELGLLDVSEGSSWACVGSRKAKTHGAGCIVAKRGEKLLIIINNRQLDFHATGC